MPVFNVSGMTCSHCGARSPRPSGAGRAGPGEGGSGERDGRAAPASRRFARRSARRAIRWHDHAALRHRAGRGRPASRGPAAEQRVDQRLGVDQRREQPGVAGPVGEQPDHQGMQRQCRQARRDAGPQAGRGVAQQVLAQIDELVDEGVMSSASRSSSVNSHLCSRMVKIRRFCSLLARVLMASTVRLRRAIRACSGCC